MRHWLDGFGHHVSLSLLSFLVAGASALIIALVTVLSHALIVARAKPVEALRYDESAPLLPTHRLTVFAKIRARPVVSKTTRLCDVHEGLNAAHDFAVDRDDVVTHAFELGADQVI
jgi:hypothetical protein